MNHLRLTTFLTTALLLPLFACGEDTAEASESVSGAVGLFDLDDLVRVKGVSEYHIGSHEFPPKLVVDVQAFFIASTETTQELYQRVMGSNPAIQKGDGDLPVENVSWEDAARFCNALSRKMGRTECYDVQDDFACDLSADGFRLPTAAEWELACRGRKLSPYPWGDDFDDQGKYCVPPVSKQRHRTLNEALESMTSPVRTKQPFRGLYDMIGNVSEWCNDPFDGDSTVRVYKGGNWADWTKGSFLTEWRGALHRDDALPTIGFRFVTRSR